MFLRVEVAMRPEFSDPGADTLLRRIELVHPQLRRKIRWARLLDVYWLHLETPREKLIPAVQEIFLDPVMKWLFTGDLIPSAAGKFGGMLDLMDAAPHLSGRFWGLERRYRPAVTDNVGRTAVEACQIVLGDSLKEARAASGALFLVEGQDLDDDALSVIARDVFCNELIESWTLLTEEELQKSARFHPDQVRRQLPAVRLRGNDQVDTVPLDGLSDEELEKMSRDRLWALTAEEIRAIRDHFSNPHELERRKALGLGPITDVEMEVLAQTWSEHCKHKIFGAKVDYREDIRSASGSGEARPGRIPGEIDSLFQETIAGTTSQIPRPWLLSVFSDNAGIVAFDEKDAICIKVETHNSPSALDPYGGSLTGIVGVNRDILGCGRGARPIFNTDVFCLAAPDFQQSLPDRILHPRRILDGVRRGVEDGGNKSGIPTVNGALVFDQRYLGKPLVYCGTGGILPRESAGMRGESKEILPGDHICMVGGRIGKDGIHGATFSSLALDEMSPATAVQLGDPITQKRAADFLLEARDLGLFRTLTDNGAGGLSSSVGELATLSGGARMDVGKAKTKYAGLRPFELVVSESQERMTVAVPPQQLDQFLALAERRGTEVSVLGEFTDTGSFDIFYNEKPIASLDLHFLHKGNPQLRIDALWKGLPPKPGTINLSFEKEGPRRLLDLLGRPNIASKEWMIRQYDHEVQGTSVVKPLHTVAAGTSQEKSGPNDGAVVKPKPDSWAGIAVGCGINPKYSDLDPYLMAQAVVDEAVRNTLAVGAEYGSVDSVFALIDNFCWPDPVKDPEKMGALVRACYGMKDAALALGLPFISGKDSMKNDYRGKRDGRDIHIAVPPTLLVTAMARVPDIRESRTSDFKSPGNLIYLLGGSSFGLLGSELHAMFIDRLREKGGNVNQVVLPVNGVEDSGSSGDESADAEAPELRIPAPDWFTARRVYGWIGHSEGKQQALLRSMHDVSEGGLLTALAESLIARGLGATVEFPEGVDLWEFGFGEGFHSFVVSAGEAEALVLEAEWRELGVPFLKLGTVNSSGALEVVWKNAQQGYGRWSVNVRDLRKAWAKEGYWE